MALICGCADNGASTLNAATAYNQQHAKDVQSPQDTQKAIDAIRNNPNMPPQAKEMAIAQMQAHMGGGKH